MHQPDRRQIIQQKLFCAEDRPAATISTGVPMLDHGLAGGLPRGRMVELFGPPGSGKTTLALQIAAHVQRDLGVAWIDAERAFDAAYAAACGVSLEGLPVLQPETAEQALEICRRLAASCAVDLIIVDSAAALVPRLELETNIGDPSPGLHASVLASGLRRLATAAGRSGTSVVFLNQMRGEEGTAGGAPLKLYAAARIGIVPRPGGKLAFRIVKNKVATPLTTGEIRTVRR